MRRASIFFMVAMLASHVLGFDYATSTATFTNTASSRESKWQDFEWHWDTRSDRNISVTFSGVTGGSNIWLRMAYPERGYTYLTVANGTFSKTWNTVSWSTPVPIAVSNIPPPRTYYAEFLLVSTNGSPTRSLAKGKISTEWSLFEITNTATWTPVTISYSIDGIIVESDPYFTSWLSTNTLFDVLEASIGSNDVDIAANTVAIGSNDVDIAANTVAIGSNDVDIAANTAAIGSNDVDIAANTAAIGSNDVDIAANTAAIGSNDVDIAAVDLRVGANETNVVTYAAAIGSNDVDIAANTAAIGSNDVDIAAVDLRVGANETNVVTYAAAIGSNDVDIAANTAAIGSNDVDIAANTAAIGSNDVDIAINLAAISSNDVDLTAVGGRVTTVEAWPTNQWALGYVAYLWGNHADAGYLTAEASRFDAIYAADVTLISSNISGLTQGTYTGVVASVAFTAETAVVVGHTYVWGFSKENSYGTSTLSIAGATVSQATLGMSSNYFVALTTNKSLTLTLVGDGSSKANVSNVFVRAVTNGSAYAAEAFVAPEGRFGAVYLPMGSTEGYVLAYTNAETGQLGLVAAGAGDMLESEYNTNGAVGKVDYAIYADSSGDSVTNAYGQSGADDSATVSNREVIVTFGPRTALYRYSALATGDEEILVVASSTNVTAARSGSTITFTIPAGTILAGTRIRYNGSSGSILTVNLGSNDMGNTGLADRWGVSGCTVYREDSGAEIVTAPSRLDLTDPEQVKVSGLWTGGINHIMLSFF